MEEILQILKSENKIQTTTIGKIIITAHSGGYRPAIFSVASGKLDDKIREVYLFDAFYAETDRLIFWLKQDKQHRLRSIYTQHLAEAHQNFMALLKKSKLAYAETLKPSAQIVLSPTDVCHDGVIEGTFQQWLEGSCLTDRIVGY